MSRTLIVDADQTILDFSSAFHQWMVEQGIETHDDQILTPRNRIHDVYKASLEELALQLVDFSHSEAFERLQPLEHAVEAIRRFQEAEWTIHVVTSCDDHQNSQKRRHTNLAKLFNIQPSHVHFAGLLGSKTGILSQLPTGYFVDDSLTHVREAIALGHTGILIHNDKEDHENLEKAIFCADDWLEAQFIIDEMCNINEQNY